LLKIARQYFVTKNKFLLQRFTEFLPDRYKFYSGDLVIYLDSANIIQGMKRLQAFKFRIEPNGEQQRAMRRIAGTRRFAYNKALALQIANHQQGQKFVNHFEMCKWLPVWKQEPETLWLKETPSQLYQVVLKDLARAK
jgi:hypothetical protein